MVWFNDIETDAMCENWSTDMRDLVQSHEEVIHVRKNLAQLKNVMAGDRMPINN
jgi:hypothetical protein